MTIKVLKDGNKETHSKKKYSFKLNHNVEKCDVKETI